MILIDTLAYSSKLRTKNPQLKIIFSIGVLLICVGARSLMFSIFLLGFMSTLNVIFGGASWHQYLKLITLPLGFLLLGIIPALLQNSLIYACRLFLTSLASITCLYFLALTTPMVDILTALRSFHCPKIIVEIMFLTYRFLFVLLNVASFITTAQICRLGNKNFKTSLRSTGQMLAILLQRSLIQSTMLYKAMESRCYDGQILVLNQIQPANSKEKLLVTFFLTFVFALAILSRTLP